MPTPVSTALHSLAPDSSAALSSAVSAARRRSHSQTTSLHLISSLLSSPLLRRALSPSPTPLHLKALDLSFSVALDRLPSSHNSADEPPISNSLMAAIKRSQAHQRRHPDILFLHHPPTSVVKVELRQLLLAILDDPVVSRVFADAGFRSYDIKLALLRPPPPPLTRRFPRGFPFPFPAAPPELDDNTATRRIADILLARHNPVLVGVGAANAAREFARAVERRNWAVLPPELHGIEFTELGGGGPEELGRGKEEGVGVVVSVGDLKGMVEEGGLVAELTRALEERSGRMWVMGWSATYEGYMKFLSRYPMLDKAWDLQLLPITSLPQPVASVGQLRIHNSMMESFIPFGGIFPATYEPKGLLSKSYQSVVRKSYQSVVRCQHCNDNYEQEVGVILKECSTSVEDQHQRNLPVRLNKADMVNANDKLDSTKAKDDRSILSAKVVDLQKKWNDNCRCLHGGCQILDIDNFRMPSHVAGPPYVSDKERVSNPISKNPDTTPNQNGDGNALSLTMGLHITKPSQSISLPVVSEPGNKDLISKLQVRLSKSEQLQTDGFQSQLGAHSELRIQGGYASPSSVTSVTTDLVLGTTYETPRTPRKEEKSATVAHMELLEDWSECLPSKKVNEIGTKVPDIVRHLNLGSSYRDPLMKDKYLPKQSLLDSKVMSGGVSAYVPRYPSSSNMCKPFDSGNFKMFYKSLIEKVGRQEEALHAISEAIVRCRTGQGRGLGGRLKGDIWLSFLGHDRVGKKRAAIALAELMFGSRENFICIDLGYQDGLCHPNTIFDQQGINENDLRFRGKTIVDHIAEMVSKNPWSVVFLENINKADFLVQTSLSQAIHTGKLSNSHGREFSINNSIFVTTAKTLPGKIFSPGKECVNFSEERILRTQGWQMKISVESVSESSGSALSSNVSITSRQEPWNRQLPTGSTYVSKRKLNPSDDNKDQHVSLGTLKRPHRESDTFLDLNMPVEEAMENDADCSSDESTSISDNSEAWVEEIFNLMDETVHFGLFDFDALADHVLKEINKSLRKIIGCECMLEVDVKVMEQILAATWLLENTRELNNWVDKVFARTLLELRRRYNLSTRMVLKLVSCEGAPMDPAPGILLPSRIIVE